MIARKDNKSSSLPEEIKICISVARIMQNPIAETLNLWNDNVRHNGCLKIPFHPLQSEVS